MKGKLIGLVICLLGGLTTAFLTGKKIQDLQREQESIDAKLVILRQQSMELLKELDTYHKRTDEEIQITKELISKIRELKELDTSWTDVQKDQANA